MEAISCFECLHTIKYPTLRLGAGGSRMLCGKRRSSWHSGPGFNGSTLLSIFIRFAWLLYRLLCGFFRCGSCDYRLSFGLS
jgi:hypothetical protein